MTTHAVKVSDEVKNFFNFLLLVEVLHFLAFQRLEHSVGGTVHNVLSLLPECKMNGGKNKLVNVTCLYGTWSVGKTFDVLGSLEDISIAKTSGHLLLLGGQLILLTAQTQISTLLDPLTGETQAPPPKPQWMLNLCDKGAVIEVEI